MKFTFEKLVGMKTNIENLLVQYLYLDKKTHYCIIEKPIHKNNVFEF